MSSGLTCSTAGGGFRAISGTGFGAQGVRRGASSSCVSLLAFARRSKTAFEAGPPVCGLGRLRGRNGEFSRDSGFLPAPRPRDDQDSRRSIEVSSVRSLTNPLLEDRCGVALVEFDQLK